jgi:hypothetical protein
MTNQKTVTRAQTKFLRGFARNPDGPPADEWPSPVVLRRWLKRPGFCGAMNSILRAMRYKADFHLTAAAASGANLLHGAVAAGDVEIVRKQIDSLIHLLRMAHIRHRFAEPLPQPESRMVDFIAWLRTVHPDVTVREALELDDRLSAEPGHEHEPGPGMALWRKTGHPMPQRHRERAAAGDEGNAGDRDDDDGDVDNDEDCAYDRDNDPCFNEEYLRNLRKPNPRHSPQG